MPNPYHCLARLGPRYPDPLADMHTIDHEIHAISLAIREAADLSPMEAERAAYAIVFPGDVDDNGDDDEDFLNEKCL